MKAFVTYNPAMSQKYNTQGKAMIQVRKMYPDIDRMLRIDNADPAQMSCVIEWLKSSDSERAEFWRPNILSSSKFRKQYPVLAGLVKGEIEIKKPKSHNLSTKRS